MTPLPPSLQTAYSNLMQAHLNQPAFEIEGAPFLRQLNKKTYWYANHRPSSGAPLKQKYLGPDTEEIRARMEQMRSERQSYGEFRTYTSSLVAQLRAGGIRGPGRKDGPILRALTNCGVFRLGGTLVGTHAFRHYDLALGLRLTDGHTTETDDIDIAAFAKLSIAIEDAADPDFAKALLGLGLKPASSLDRKTPTSWMLPDASYAIDFLTPSFSDKETPAKLATLNMWAQGLHYLTFLIAEPIEAVSPYMEGLRVKIPKPERYAVHKLIISQRLRASAAKSRKDVEQARAIIWAMADHQPHELKSAIADADSRGEKWRQALDRALQIRFSPNKPTHHPRRDGIQYGGIQYQGVALGKPMRFGVSGTLATFFEHAKRSREDIEAAIQQKFRKEPGPDTMLTSNDLPPA